MPKITMYYPNNSGFTLEERIELREKVRPMVADLIGDGITTGIVDWVSIGYEPDTLFTQGLSFEIETFGRPVRKENLNKEALLDLKDRIINLVPSHVSTDPDKTLVWTKFVDPDGHHV